jgi:hypothetical protein
MYHLGVSSISVERGYITKHPDDNEIVQAIAGIKI